MATPIEKKELTEKDVLSIVQREFMKRDLVQLKVASEKLDDSIKDAYASAKKFSDALEAHSKRSLFQRIFNL